MSESEQNPREPELLPHASPESRQAIPTIPVYRSGDDELYIPIPPASRRPRRLLPLVLFVLTCLSTLYAGAEQFAVGRLVQLPDGSVVRVLNLTGTLWNGLVYAAGVMSILGAHEMGHYLQARRYGVPASLPMFIPMPIGPFGTMGAVIVQQQGTADRRSMFDIAISGPLAGLVVALPLNWWGISTSQIGKMLPNSGGWTNPLIVEWMIAWIHRPLERNEDIALNPILFAGWVGIFITGLNLIPLGQLDGGHILYCLLRKRAHPIMRTLFQLCVAGIVIGMLFGNYQYVGWTIMLLLVWRTGVEHAPTANDDMPLGRVRTVLGWLTLLFVLVGFVASPTYKSGPPEAVPPQQLQQNLEEQFRQLREQQNLQQEEEPPQEREIPRDLEPEREISV